MSRSHPLLAGLLVLFLAACSSVPMPKGGPGNATTARFLAPEKTATDTFSDAAHAAMPVVRDAIASEFEANGIEVVTGEADLVINYVIVIKDKATTRMLGERYSGSSNEILKAAHAAGEVSGSDKDYLPKGALVIDIIDPKTNKLVYRDYSVRTLIEGISEEERAERIREATAEALAKFF